MILHVSANVKSCLQLVEDTKAVACRALWRVKEEDISMAKNQICSHRLKLDDTIIGMEGVQFFVSCITEIEQNVARRITPGEDGRGFNPEKIVYPGVSYFIAYRETSKCSKHAIFRALYEADMDPTINAIKTRNSGSLSGYEDVAIKKLAQVVKDHDNRATKELVRMSNAFCRAACRDSGSNGENAESIDRLRRPRYPQTPCRLVVVEQGSYRSPLSKAHGSLTSDGLLCELEIVNRPVHSTVATTAPSNITSILRDIGIVMARCSHALHRGFVYSKPAEATLDFVRMMDVKTYINKLLVNDALRERILRHMTRIIQLLSHPACEIIAQIEFHADYIEVSGGQFFEISSRSFIDCPPMLPFGKISPRAYIPYDSTTPPRPLHFKSGIENSFPDVHVRTAFLNKFYQCFLGRRMPHKIRKLVVSGPRDSGKTSWACVLHRIIPSNRIASITKERQFSASMINDETELVIIDDWSGQTMDSDLAKTLLQGRWFVTAIKHEQPKSVWNNSPFYITTNSVPDFGEESENVERRISVFHTQALPITTAGMDKWMFDNAMDCLVWAANEINENINHVPGEERWYENNNSQHSVVDERNIAR